MATKPKPAPEPITITIILPKTTGLLKIGTLIMTDADNTIMIEFDYSTLKEIAAAIEQGAARLQAAPDAPEPGETRAAPDNDPTEDDDTALDADDDDDSPVASPPAPQVSPAPISDDDRSDDDNPEANPNPPLVTASPLSSLNQSDDIAAAAFTASTIVPNSGQSALF